MIQLENSPILASIDETMVFSGGGVFATVMMALTQTIGLFALLGSTNIFQQLMAGVMIRDPGDLQGEPAVPRAQIDHLRALFQADSREHAGGIRPQSFPPTGGRHLGALKKTWKIVSHHAILT
jgi:hypothetical protein